MNRYDRNIQFFGKDGQKKINSATVVIVGVGGLGTHVVQQLAHLGVGRIILIDKEVMDKTNSNRYVGSKHDDPSCFPIKVDIGERIIKNINPDIEVIKINKTLVSEDAFSAIINSGYVVGCIDREGVRFILNELCSAYANPYIDLATDIIKEKPMSYGGRVFCNWDGKACLHCMGVLDVDEVQKDLSGPQGKALQEEIYGVEKTHLDNSGPSVVSINGVVASLAVTEFMVSVTGIRKPVTLSTYRGQDAKVIVSRDKPQTDCYYCKKIRGKQKAADVEGYIRNGVGKWL